MTASITRSDVQAVYGEKEPAINATKQQTLVDHAESIANTNFGGKVSTQSEIEGDEDIFAAYVGAHLWSLSEGDGSLNEEFQTGNSAPRDISMGGDPSWLKTTPYGIVAYGMLRAQGASTGIVRADF